MENYSKRPKPKEKTEDNEIRITAKGQIRNYQGYAEKVLQKPEHDSIVISATGNAIVKALILIELIKRSVGNLHQINEITSREMIDIFDPQVEGLEQIEQKRRVTAMKTVLSKNPLDSKNIGYQPPEPKQERKRREEGGDYEFTVRPKKEEKRYNDEKGGQTSQPKRQERRRYNDGPQNENKREPRRYNDGPSVRAGFRGGNRGGRVRYNEERRRSFDKDD